MKFTEKLKLLDESMSGIPWEDDGSDAWEITSPAGLIPKCKLDNEGIILLRNSLPQIIEVLEAAEYVTGNYSTRPRTGLREALDALDALVEEPKP